jgi:hypothetical protein
MMANAGRDPIFWATLAIAEQDFDGAGDLCIRCHSTAGWLAGRSTPTDGSALAAGDADGVECEYCHKLTNPNDSEYLGVQFAPFLANDLDDPDSDPLNVQGYYGSGMASLWGGSEKLGPYADAAARHQFAQSSFHRSVDFCGTCHDVSNPAVGDLAHNVGAQDTADPVWVNGQLGGTVDPKAAFNNLPFKYGVVERTFSEYKAGAWPTTRVSDYANLPAELQTGAIQAAFESAVVAGRGGDFEDGSPRYFSCQTCHLRPVEGYGCNKSAPWRRDLPLHDMTGGNYWMPDAMQFLDSLGLLRLGGGLTSVQVAALNDGKTRVLKQLSQAVSLIVDENKNLLRVVNLTGHKVISGYPEGRRMWLNIVWEDADGASLREDGAYGPLADANGDPVTVADPLSGQPVQVSSILDLYPAPGQGKIYEAHYGLTGEWASQLLSLGYDPQLVLAYDRTTGNSEITLGELAVVGGDHESFHFVLNNAVVKDNRIPPYQMDYEEARRRNALPVPASQYGGPAPGGVYNHWDEVPLTPPAGAVYASIKMLYQPTSWEYIQFLHRANHRDNAFLADEGGNLLLAWLRTGMAEPYAMATAEWGKKAVPPTPMMWMNDLSTWALAKRGQESASTVFVARDTVRVKALVVGQTGIPLSGAQVFLEISGPSGAVVQSLQGFTDDTGVANLDWKTGRRQAAGEYQAKVVSLIKSGYAFDDASGTTAVLFAIQ